MEKQRIEYYPYLTLLRALSPDYIVQSSMMIEQAIDSHPTGNEDNGLPQTISILHATHPEGRSWLTGLLPLVHLGPKQQIHMGTGATKRGS